MATYKHLSLKLGGGSKWSKLINRCLFFLQKANICVLVTLHFMSFLCRASALSAPASATVYIRCSCIICRGWTSSVAELSLLIIDSCSWGKQINWIPLFCKRNLMDLSTWSQSSQPCLWKCVHLEITGSFVVTQRNCVCRRRQNTGTCYVLLVCQIFLGGFV